MVTIESTRSFFDEHTALRTDVEELLVAAHEFPNLPRERRVDLVEHVVAFVGDVLVPHADAERRVLYPGARAMIGDCGCSEVAVDCAEIRDRVADLAEADVDDTGRLQELSYALYALCSMNLQREEEVYLRLVEQGSDKDVHALLERTLTPH